MGVRSRKRAFAGEVADGVMWASDLGWKKVAPPSLAITVRTLRKELDLTQPQLAKTLKVTRSSVAQWEAGTRKISAENCKALEKLASDAAIARGQQPQTKLPTGELTRLSYWFGKMAASRIADGEAAALKAAKKREQAREELYTVSRLVETVRLARQGDSFAKELLELSAMGEDEFEARQRASMASQQRSIGRTFYQAQTIRLGRRHLVELGISALRRELERVGAKAEDFPSLERVIGIELCKAEDSDLDPGEKDGGDATD